MNQEMKAFSGYVESIFAIDRVSLYLLSLLHSVCADLDSHPSKAEPSKEDLDARLSEALGHEVSSARLGITDVDKAVVPHAKRKHRILSKALVSDGFTLSYDILAEQFGSRMRALRRKEEKKLKEAGVEVPPHVKEFLIYLREEEDDGLQKEFLSRLKVCESMKDVSSMCDEMRRDLSLDELRGKLDDISASAAATEGRLQNIESAADWLVIHSLFD